MATALLFAKPPRAGEAKTRLAPLVGEDRAAELAAAFLADSWAALCAVDGLRAVISTPDPRPEAWALSPVPTLWAQGGGDLGARLERGLRRALASDGPALALGADAPDLGPERIATALAALDAHEAVLLPATDGGFALLGLRRCPEGLLADLPWSQPHTGEATLARLREAGMSVAMLSAWHDVDEPRALRALAARVAEHPERAPHTAAALAARPLPARISVVVPTYNEAARVGAALDRLAAEPGIEELLVVDGESTDATRDIVAARGVRLIEAERGRAGQMNAGARATQGEILWFVHADVALPGGAPTLVRSALAEPGVVAGAFVTRTVSEGVSRPWSPLLRAADLRSRVTRHPYGDQAVFVRREDFDAVGGFPELALMEDVALAEALRTRGRIARIDARVTVSGRRFLRRPVRTMLAWNALPFLYRRGVPTRWLARLYGTVR